MIKIYEGITKEQADELYSHPSMRRSAHDFLELKYIDHALVSYYSVFVDGVFMGAYLVVFLSPIEVEAHMMLFPKIGVHQREATREMARILFEKTDRISTIVIDGLESSKNHLTKMGFKLEGIKRDAFQVNGIKKDGYLFGLLKTDLKD